MSDMFISHVTRVRYYYVYKSPRHCKYEIIENLYIMVEGNKRDHSYTAVIANNPAIKRYGWGRTPKIAIKALVYELAEYHAATNRLIKENKAGALLEQECAAIGLLIRKRTKKAAQ